MTRKIFDLAIPTDSYTDSTGKTRATWVNVGAMFETDSGRKFIRLKRFFTPAGVPLDENGNNREAVIINLFAGKERG